MPSLILSLINKSLIFNALFSNYKLLLLQKEKHEKLVSIIVPNYNDSKFIVSTLYSISAQSYKNIECIVVDDCSTDNSCKVIEEFISENQFKGIKFRLIKHEENKGLSAARNSGGQESLGEFVLFLDSDDLLTKNSILTKVRKLEKTEDFVAGVYSRIKYCSETGPRFHQILSSFFPYTLQKDLHFAAWDGGYPFTVHSVLLRNSIFKAFKKGFDEKFKDGVEDYDMWYRILRHGYVFKSSKWLGGFYRQKKNSMLLGGFQKHFEVFESIVSNAFTKSSLREVRDSPFWHNLELSYYHELYIKFDRYIRFQKYLEIDGSFFYEKYSDKKLLKHLYRIYPVKRLESFLKRIKL